jgi:hypothetical protein
LSLSVSFIDTLNDFSNQNKYHGKKSMTIPIVRDKIRLNNGLPSRILLEEKRNEKNPNNNNSVDAAALPCGRMPPGTKRRISAAFYRD